MLTSHARGSFAGWVGKPKCFRRHHLTLGNGTGTVDAPSCNVLHRFNSSLIACIFDRQTRVLRRELLAEIGDEALAKHQIVVGDPSSFQVRHFVSCIVMRWREH